MNINTNFEIIYLNENVDNNLIQNYWEIDYSYVRWKFNVQSIAEVFGINMRDVSYYAKQNSRFRLYCQSCNKLIGEYKLRSEINFSDYFNKSEILCDTCYLMPKSKYYKNDIKYSISNVNRSDKMNFAFETKQWLDLNQPELEVLIKVAESQSKYEIFSKVFQNSNPRSEYREFYWNILNKLENLSLIWMERNLEGKIIKIHKHGDLYNTLLETYPNLIIPRNSETV